MRGTVRTFDEFFQYPNFVPLGRNTLIELYALLSRRVFLDGLSLIYLLLFFIEHNI